MGEAYPPPSAKSMRTSRSVVITFHGVPQSTHQSLPGEIQLPSLLPPSNPTSGQEIGHSITAGNSKWQIGLDFALIIHSPATSIYLFGVLRRFQHCTGHITTGSWKGRGNQYIQLLVVLYCKLLTNGKQLPAFPLEVRPGTEF